MADSRSVRVERSRDTDAPAFLGFGIAHPVGLAASIRSIMPDCSSITRRVNSDIAPGDAPADAAARAGNSQ
ncbi:hypothetical protein [Novosphingobium sp.]|uniref:hypothetical protein n=1 Tax=Novosphingobium sp. TaxID=1874826 RepID=UPI0027363A66|nr:hypothetical protein [Novosphingobium sp.]MDP3907398.1 hypothetical protein [Novosphingobium sp.]